MRLAETVTRDAHAVSDEQFAELRSFYSEGEIVELLCAIGLFNYFNRFNNALQDGANKTRRRRLRGASRTSNRSVALIRSPFHIDTNVSAFSNR